MDVELPLNFTTPPLNVIDPFIDTLAYDVVNLAMYCIACAVVSRRLRIGERRDLRLTLVSAEEYVRSRFPGWLFILCMLLPLIIAGICGKTFMTWSGIAIYHYNFTTIALAGQGIRLLGILLASKKAAAYAKPLSWPVIIVGAFAPPLSIGIYAAALRALGRFSYRGIEGGGGIHFVA